MRKLGLFLAIVLGLVTTSLMGANAATIVQNIGVINAANPSASFGFNAVTAPDFKLNSSGQGTFQINFTLGSDVTDTAGSFTATSVTSVALSAFTFGLYDSANHLLSQVDQTTALYPGGKTTFSLLDFASLLKSGAYYLLLDVTSGKAGQKINGNVDISPVPLPAALPMFGAALLGLAGLRQMRKKMSV